MTDPTRIPVRRAAEDTPELWPVRRREVLARGRLFDYFSDTVEMPSGDTMRRDFIDHTSAVAVIALDDDEHMVVVHQYRHPVGFRLIEPPAGLLDQDGEGWLRAAQRELAEEAGLAADDWRLLVDMMTTPGGVNESIRIYLARDLRAAGAPDGFEPEGEEAHMDVLRVPVDDLLTGILSGRLQSPSLVAGVLAYAAARDKLDRLRPADSPWPARGQVERMRAAAPETPAD
ncbi:MAG TPA: NUDIX hydrolase [Propionibacterium sp.]|jgi:ADP-ribose pyrophosphatase|nr:NUDIX hydrolase [Propionibacterium sp.]